MAARADRFAIFPQTRCTSGTRKCNEGLARKRKRLHNEDTLGPPGFFRGGRVKVLASATLHAGEVCVVDDFEQRLEGRSAVYSVHLKSLEGSKTFQLQSVYLQPCTEAAEGADGAESDFSVDDADSDANDGES